MEFDWDEANEGHVLRHGIRPHEAEAALADTDGLRIGAYNMPGERRAALLGDAGSGRVLFVVFTRRGKRLRVVTARLASPAQRQRYLRR